MNKSFRKPKSNRNINNEGQNCGAGGLTAINNGERIAVPMIYGAIHEFGFGGLQESDLIVQVCNWWCIPKLQ